MLFIIVVVVSVDCVGMVFWVNVLLFFEINMWLCLLIIMINVLVFMFKRIDCLINGVMNVFLVIVVVE